MEDLDEDLDSREGDLEGIVGSLAKPQERRLDSLVGSGRAGSSTTTEVGERRSVELVAGEIFVSGGGADCEPGLRLASSKMVSMLGTLGVELILEGRYRGRSSLLLLSLLPDSSLLGPGARRPSLSNASEGPASGEDRSGRDSRRGEAGGAARCECRRIMSGRLGARGGDLTSDWDKRASGKMLPG